MFFFSEDVTLTCIAVGDDEQQWHLWSDRANNYQHQQDVYSNSLHRSQSYPASQPTKLVVFLNFCLQLFIDQLCVSVAFNIVTCCIFTPSSFCDGKLHVSDRAIQLPLWLRQTGS